MATGTANIPDLTATAAGLTAVVVFVIAYLFVISEEFTHLRKSKPMVVAAGIVWALVAVAWHSHGLTGAVDLLQQNAMELGELLLFLVAAMTYVNTLEERNVFAALRSELLARKLTLRAVFWITGLLAFFLSPVLDNLTTALVMGAVALALGRGNRAFVAPACINIVVAANAGGAFSPFGDITTLMVWQKGVLSFFEFFRLFVPSLVNWLVPAACMSLAIPVGVPESESARSPMLPGGGAVVALFAVTIIITVSMHQFLHLPPFLGMMTGLGLLQVAGYFIRRRELADGARESGEPRRQVFDIFANMKRVEWDTLLFFYGVMLCVGG